jgi:hypothetical protein
MWEIRCICGRTCEHCTRVVGSLVADIEARRPPPKISGATLCAYFESLKNLVESAEGFLTAHGLEGLSCPPRVGCYRDLALFFARALGRVQCLRERLESSSCSSRPTSFPYLDFPTSGSGTTPGAGSARSGGVTTQIPELYLG